MRDTYAWYEQNERHIVHVVWIFHILYCKVFQDAPTGGVFPSRDKVYLISSIKTIAEVICWTIYTYLLFPIVYVLKGVVNVKGRYLLCDANCVKPNLKKWGSQFNYDVLILLIIFNRKLLLITWSHLNLIENWCDFLSYS